jgi:hypothetical protein
MDIFTGGVQGGQQLRRTEIGVHREDVAQCAHPPVGAAGHPEAVLVGGGDGPDLDQGVKKKLALRGSLASVPLGTMKRVPS